MPNDDELLGRARAALPWNQEGREEIYWRHRYAGALDAAELRVLELERHLARKSSDLARLKARRWWKIGEALAGARSSISGLFRLPVKLIRTALGANQLPATVDTTSLEHQIEALRRSEGADHLAIVALANRRYEEAEQLTDSALDKNPLDYGALHTKAKLLVATGELTSAHRYVGLLIDIHPTSDLRQWADDLRGLVISTDPMWLPDIPGPPEPLASPNQGRVLHLLKESLPFYERGYTMRSHHNLLAARLAGFHPVVTTALGFPRSQGHEEFEQLDTIDGIRHHRLDLGAEYDSAAVPLDNYLLDWAWQAAAVVRSERPAAIHAGSGHHGFDTALVGLALSKHFQIPFIYEVRSSLEQTWTGDPEIAEQGEYYERRLAQEYRCMAEADLVLAISQTLADDIVARGIDPTKVHLFPNGVDPSKFEPRTKRSDLIARYGLDDSPVVGYVSNLGTREGVDVLIRAIADLRAGGIETKGLIVGDGPRRDDLARLIGQLGVGDLVTLVGQVSQAEVIDHYALIDIFVIPRTTDRAARLITPLKPYEAMAMGVPIVVSDLPALAEIVAGGRGEVFKPESPEALAAALADLIADQARRAQLAERALAWVTAERTWESNGSRLTAAYATIGLTS